MITQQNLEIHGCFLFESVVFPDERGSFREWYWSERVPFTPSQGNVSTSKKGIVRGLHLSVSAAGQAKWITCLAGEINDVIVDLRPNSPTFLKMQSIKLSPSSGLSLSIPAGIAHGFASLEQDSIVGYLVSAPFDPAHEVGIHPFDKSLDIDWDVQNPKLSSKDQSGLSLDDFLLKYRGELENFY
jgi:dTDP-4-dehydrorhamnose 3,5-epimerase